MSGTLQRLLAMAMLTWKAAFRFRLFWVLTGLLPILAVSALRISAAIRQVAVAAIAVSRADLLRLLLANRFVV